MRSVARRRSEPSTASRTCSGRLSSPVITPFSIRKPNLVAMITRSRPPGSSRSARASSSSFTYGP